MALRRCWRLTGLLLRLPAPPGSSSPVGRLTVSSFINTYGGFKSAEFQLRRFSSEARNTDVSYERLKQLLSYGKAVVVDVREPWELREYGLVPGSVNVPLGQVNTALQLDPEEFREKYDGVMPTRTDKIVFLCLAGIRSKTALNTAVALGYRDAQHYPGGWQDWAEREQHK
ncbi:thiosulfate sulfurtransferase/rhodanese-like domain-containing protein 3 [Girardinichthys multiradiatus]|uniref:thiosulfate sulfurtransferase/rhodanese-like domain-containing protein 3 n=1 Tax=Girardinichthys multiradiatus TaxID=208333 RepID=UPI001FAD6D20|nr:thiosulfate sulfurtransferase/rhodanese-like domain-containing protein 3 [Girardinichthys multiradiatus]